MHSATKPGFEFYSFYAEMPGKFLSSSKNNENMQTVQFQDTLAMGKSCTLTKRLKKNSAGNYPDLVPDDYIASSSDESIATAEVGPMDPETGKYSLKTNYTGKKGAVVTTLSVNPDLDGSGDPRIEFSLATVITTEEANAANGFEDDGEVSGLE
jgi:hypothetical protein